MLCVESINGTITPTSVRPYVNGRWWQLHCEPRTRAVSVSTGRMRSA